MARFQIEIDAPVLLRVEADNADEAERIGDAAYVAFWEVMNEAVKKLSEEIDADVNLGERYDNTDVGVIDEATGDVR